MPTLILSAAVEAEVESQISVKRRGGTRNVNSIDWWDFYTYTRK